MEEELEEGQELDVVCKGRDARGHVKVSRKALLDPAPDQAQHENRVQQQPSQAGLGGQQPPAPDSPAASEPRRPAVAGVPSRIYPEEEIKSQQGCDTLAAWAP